MGKGLNQKKPVGIHPSSGNHEHNLTEPEPEPKTCAMLGNPLQARLCSRRELNTHGPQQAGCGRH